MPACTKKIQKPSSSPPIIMYIRKGERPTSKSPQPSNSAASYISAGDVDPGHDVRGVKRAGVMAVRYPSPIESVQRIKLGKMARDILI
jgi:hypothetical protein